MDTNSDKNNKTLCILNFNTSFFKYIFGTFDGIVFTEESMRKKTNGHGKLLIVQRLTIFVTVIISLSIIDDQIYHRVFGIQRLIYRS